MDIDERKSSLIDDVNLFAFSGLDLKLVQEMHMQRVLRKRQSFLSYYILKLTYARDERKRLQITWISDRYFNTFQIKNT